MESENKRHATRIIVRLRVCPLHQIQSDQIKDDKISQICSMNWGFEKYVPGKLEGKKQNGYPSHRLEQYIV
jgi:hypothetical protein